MPPIPQVAQRVLTHHLVSLKACFIPLLFLSGRGIFHPLSKTSRAMKRACETLSVERPSACLVAQPMGILRQVRL